MKVIPETRRVYEISFYYYTPLIHYALSFL